MKRTTSVVLTVVIVFAAAFLFYTFFTEIANAQKPMTLGVHPYLPKSVLLDQFTPLADYLSREVDQPVTVEVSSDYQEHIDKIGSDKLDIAYMGPASYVKVVDNYGPKSLLARIEINGKPTFQGVIIVAKDSSLTNMADLAGKIFAFGDWNSTMSHLVPRYMIFKAGVGIEKLADHKFLKNHHNVALGVLMGDFDAGAVKEEVFYEYEDRGLKILSKTPQISEHVFVVSNLLSSETVLRLRKALYRLRDDVDGLLIMSSIKKNMTGMVPAKDEDYNNLREIFKFLETNGIRP